jgi:hypothetical protein
MVLHCWVPACSGTRQPIYLQILVEKWKYPMSKAKGSAIDERMFFMPVQRVDVIYIDFKFHSVPGVGFSGFAVNRQRVESIPTRFAYTSGAAS